MHRGIRRVGPLLVVLWAAGVRAGTVECPAGEITLSAPEVRLVRRGPGRDRVRAGRAAFALPAGVTADPLREPVTFVLEADRQPLAVLAGPLPRARIRWWKGVRSYRLRFSIGGLDLAGLDPAHPPARLKHLVKIGDDCFSTLLACSARGARVSCRPERTAVLHGRVREGRAPLAGVMVTASDDTRRESVTVFSQEDGRYVLPPVRPGTYRLRVRRPGFTDVTRAAMTLAADRGTRLDFTLERTADFALQLPAAQFMWRLLDKWSDQKFRADFTLSCGNCHQIGSWRFRRAKTEAEWRAWLEAMIQYVPPYFQETRDQLIDNVIATFGPAATIPPPALPPPPAGDILRAVVYEYFLGDATRRPGCHDLELGTDGVVYADAGVRWIDPRTGERGTHQMTGGGHSIERAPDGNMWITQAGEDALARLDVTTGQFTYHPLPKLGDEQGSYPHTLRFDAQQRIWLTLTKSNHLALFDPPTAQFTYRRLPAADPAEVGLSIPIAYGCDTAPDGRVWWSQLMGERIGVYDPATDTMRAWRPPFWGPRRLHVGADGMVWVPGYASGVLGRFDPATERWKVYDLPTGVPGPPGFGNSEMPYSLNANRMNGEVWLTGSNSDTLIRFVPEREEFTAFPLPTLNSFTREVEFDPDNNVWTCTSNMDPEPGVEGRGRFVKLELPPLAAECGNAIVEPGEECDDGNTLDCDRCTTRCRLTAGCGDGARCGTEACDDGNDDDCDGCSATCAIETGLRCGDGLANTACGETCDPPVPGGCSATCTRIPRCGDGLVDPGEECDDGDTDDCNACTNGCRLAAGCGDGAVCGAEICDDGGTAACDGCAPDCTPEPGLVCGDGIVNAACGEECDPPGAGPPACTAHCRVPRTTPLGTRHLSFGGATYTSALGPAVALGTLIGAFDVTGGVPDLDGVAPLDVPGPTYYRAPILGGSFGNLCVRIAGCTGLVDCDGGTAAGVQTVQDSAGPGRQDNPPLVTTGLGPDGGPGAVLLTCQQAVVQVGPAQTDCTAVGYPAHRPVVYTTGSTEASYVNGNPRIGTGQISMTAGETFDCDGWMSEDGPGRLAGAFLMEEDPQAGDTANVNVIDD